MNAAGDFVVVWDDDASYHGHASCGRRRYDSAGTPLGDVFPISGTSYPAFSTGDTVASDSAGNFIVVLDHVVQAPSEGR